MCRGNTRHKCEGILLTELRNNRQRGRFLFNSCQNARIVCLRHLAENTVHQDNCADKKFYEVVRSLNCRFLGSEYSLIIHPKIKQFIRELFDELLDFGVINFEEIGNGQRKVKWPEYTKNWAKAGWNGDISEPVEPAIGTRHRPIDVDYPNLASSSPTRDERSNWRVARSAPRTLVRQSTANAWHPLSGLEPPPYSARGWPHSPGRGAPSLRGPLPLSPVSPYLQTPRSSRRPPATSPNSPTPDPRMGLRQNHEEHAAMFTESRAAFTDQPRQALPSLSIDSEAEQSFSIGETTELLQAITQYHLESEILQPVVAALERMRSGDLPPDTDDAGKMLRSLLSRSGVSELWCQILEQACEGLQLRHLELKQRLSQTAKETFRSME